jgi:hypothetical protein
VTTPLVVPAITVTLDGAATPVRPDRGSLSLDAARVPYAGATIVLPLTADTALDDLDPRDDHRVIINGGNTGHWEGHPDLYTGYGHGPYGHGPYGKGI